VPFLYGMVFRFFGESRAFIQAFTSLLFSLSAVLTYLIGKTLWDKETGTRAGWLLLGIPYLFTQAPLMLVDVPTMFFFILSVYSFIRAIQAPGLGLWTVLSGAAIFLTLFSKYSTWVMLSVLPVALAVISAKGGSKKAPLKNAGLVLLLTAFFSLSFVFLKWDVVMAQLKFLSSYQVPGLRRWGESFTSTFLFQVHPFITAFALFSVWRAAKARDWKLLIPAFLPALVLVTGLKRTRYIIMVFPMVALMASVGLGTIRSAPLRRFIVFSVLAASLSLGLAGFLPYLKKESAINLKEAGAFLNKNGVPGVEVFTVGGNSPVNPAVAVPSLDLYTDKKIRYRHQDPYSGTGLPKDLLISPFRFTWEHRNPSYYEYETLPAGAGVVVIATGPGTPLPPGIKKRTAGLREAARFNASTGIFRFQTFVTVYLP